MEIFSTFWLKSLGKHEQDAHAYVHLDDIFFFGKIAAALSFLQLNYMKGEFSPPFFWPLTLDNQTISDLFQIS